MKKIFPKFLFATILFFLFPAVSFAQVVINEIFYSPASKQWVEIYNNTNNEIDITQYKILDNGAFKEGHGISAFVSGNNTLPAHSYAVVAEVPSDFNTSYLFKSSLGIEKTGDTLILKDAAKNEISKKQFLSSDGANGDGNSLQLQTDGSWKAASPTPGAVNSTTSNISDNSNTSGEVLGDSTSSSSGSSSSSSGSSLTNVSSLSAQLDVQAGSDRTTSPGSPIWFQATVKKNTTSIGPELNWSFGDGNVGVGPLVSHTYKYSGDYAVVLSARAGDIFSISRLKVKVVDSNISVEDKGEYLEISNNSDSEINLFNWKLENKGKGFIFQPNTIILPHSSIKLDKALLTMKGYDNSQGTVLKNCSGSEIFASIPMSQSPIANLALTEIIPESFYIAQAKLEQSENEIQPEAAAPEVLGEATSIDTTDTPIDNIIYEAPKQEGLLARLTNFLKRVFSR